MSIIVQIRESSGQLVQGLALGTCGQLVARMWISPGTYFLWGDGQRTRGQQNTALLVQGEHLWPVSLLWEAVLLVSKAALAQMPQHRSDCGTFLVPGLLSVLFLPAIKGINTWNLHALRHLSNPVLIASWLGWVGNWEARRVAQAPSPWPNFSFPQELGAPSFPSWTLPRAQGRLCLPSS